MKHFLRFTLCIATLFFSGQFVFGQNTPPVFVSTPITSVDEHDEMYVYDIEVSDIDGDSISYTVENLPTWLNLRVADEALVSTISVDKQSVLDDARAVGVDNNGVLYFTTRYSIQKVVEGKVTTLAGLDWQSGFANGEGTQARFDFLQDIAFDSENNIYVSDFRNNRIRKVTPEGIVSTLAGSGQKNRVDGTGTSAALYNPSSMAIDAFGNLYVAETSVIRKITPDGVVSTFAGTLTKENIDGTLEEARFGAIRDLDFDKEGNLYVLSESVLRKISPEGIVSTVAGNLSSDIDHDGTGTDATFPNAGGIKTDELGNIYISSKTSIRKVSPEGEVITVAGTFEEASIRNGLGEDAAFRDAKSIARDKLGNLYVLEAVLRNIRKLEFPIVRLSGEPNGNEGSYEINLKASDGKGGEAFQTFVIDVSSAPLITSASSVAIDENSTGAAYKIVVLDNEDVVFSLGNVRDEALFDINEDVVSFKTAPDFENQIDANSDNIYEIEIKASNGQYESSKLVNITVLNLSETAPVFTSQPLSQIRESDNYNYTIDATDLDGDKIEYSAEGLPSWMALQFPQVNVSVFAGSNDDSYSDFYGMDIDQFGNVYWATRVSVLKINPEGEKSVLATEKSDNGIGEQINFTWLNDLAVDASKTVYVIDQSKKIKTINKEGIISTLMSPSNNPFVNSAGEPFSFNRLESLALDNKGTLYISDNLLNGIGQKYHGRILKVEENGVVSILLGEGGSIGNPNDYSLGDIDLDKKGNLYASLNSSMIVKISPQGQSIVVAGSSIKGNKDGTGTGAQFTDPGELSVDNHGNIYLSNQVSTGIKRISKEGVVSTIAKSYIKEGGELISQNLVVSNNGDVYFGNSEDEKIYKITFPSPSLKNIGEPEIGKYKISLKARDPFNGSTKQTFILEVLGDKPNLVSSLPLAGGNEFYGKSVSLTFDKPMEKGMGSISIHDASNDNELWKVGVRHPSVSIEGNTVSLSLRSLLPLNKQVYLNIEPEALKSQDGAYFEGITNNSDLAFSTKTDLVLVTSNPIVGQEDVWQNTMTLTFNRGIEKGFGSITIKDALNHSVVWSSGINHPRVKISGSQLSISLDDALEYENDYYINIDSKAIRDEDGLFYSGILTKTDLYFSTAARPKMISSNPTDNEIGFRGTTISLTFDREIYKGAGEITIKDAENDEVLWSKGINHPNISIDGMVLSIDITRPLPINKNAFLNINNTALKDDRGIFYEGIDDKTTLNFQTNRVLSGPSLAFGGFGEEADTIESYEIVLYPNPASGLLNIALNGFGNQPTIRLTNIMGELVYEKEKMEESTLKLDVSSYSHGIYVLSAFTEEGVRISKKLTIQK